MTENNDNNGIWKGQPWYIKAIAMVGVPSLLVVALVWSDRVQLIYNLRDQLKIITEMKLEAELHIAQDTLINNKILNTLTETNRIILAGCVNSANTNEARDRCNGLINK